MSHRSVQFISVHFKFTTYNLVRITKHRAYAANLKVGGGGGGKANESGGPRLLSPLIVALKLPASQKSGVGPETKNTTYTDNTGNSNTIQEHENKLNFTEGII